MDRIEELIFENMPLIKKIACNFHRRISHCFNYFDQDDLSQMIILKILQRRPKEIYPIILIRYLTDELRESGRNLRTRTGRHDNGQFVVVFFQSLFDSIEKPSTLPYNDKEMRDFLDEMKEVSKNTISIHDVISALSDPYRFVIEQVMNGVVLKEIGDKIGKSESRMSQVLTEAKRQLLIQFSKLGIEPHRFKRRKKIKINS